MTISARVKEIPVSAIHEMTRLSQQYEDVAFLSWAKPMSETPKHICEGAIHAIEQGLTSGYSPSPGIPELRAAVAEKLRRDNAVDALATQILVTVGSIEGLAAAVMASVDPGDEVLLPTPTYSTHITQVTLASAVPVLVPLIEAQGYALDIDAFERAITRRTKAIMICTPNNPTGTVFRESDLRRLAALAVEHDLTVIVDEAYEYFTFDPHRHFSLASIPEIADSVVTCYTFTKTYVMTGWRIGYLHASEERITEINKAHIPFAICAPVVSQHAALAALRGSQDCVEHYRRRYQSMRDLMCERLDRLDAVFSYVTPGGSYLMFPRILTDTGSDSMRFCKQLLAESRVSVTPGIAFGPTGEEHVRMSFCVPESMINKAFDRMERYFGV